MGHQCKVPPRVPFGLAVAPGHWDLWLRRCLRQEKRSIPAGMLVDRGAAWPPWQE